MIVYMLASRHISYILNELLGMRVQTPMIGLLIWRKRKNVIISRFFFFKSHGPRLPRISKRMEGGFLAVDPLSLWKKSLCKWVHRVCALRLVCRLLQQTWSWGEQTKNTSCRCLLPHVASCPPPTPCLNASDAHYSLLSSFWTMQRGN